MRATEDAGNVPKRTKRIKKHLIPMPVNQPVNQPVIQPNTNIDPKTAIPPEIVKELDLRLQEILKHEIKQQQKKNVEDYAPLERIVTEYLKSFLIIGYTLKGEKIVIGHALTQQEHDSLVEHLRHVFMHIIGNEM